MIYKNHGEVDFFTANIIDIITILLGTIITIYISESMTDQRRKNDCIEHVITEIENLVKDDNNFSMNKIALINQTSCANRIKYLNDVSFSEIKEDMEFISNNFENIKDIYSNHNSSEEGLENVRIDLDKFRAQIIDKCCKIRISLYKN